jgi:hypothetical protein
MINDGVLVRYMTDQPIAVSDVCISIVNRTVFSYINLWLGVFKGWLRKNP